MVKKEHHKNLNRNYHLFTKEELIYFEELRKKTYSKIEKDNPQFLNEDYESFKKKERQGSRPYSTFSKRALRSLIGLDYSIANNCIKKFTNDGNFEHIINAINILGVKAFSCPVIVEIYFNLNEKYSLSLWTNNQQNRGLIEKYSQKIGKELLLDNPNIIKKNKVTLLLRKLQDSLSTKHKNELNPEDTLRHIGKIYEKHLDKLNRRERKGVVLKTHYNVLERYKDRLKQSKDPTEKKKLMRDKKKWEAKILELEKEEDKKYKEARRRTLKDLRQETGIQIKERSFRSILTEINRLKNN